MKKNESDFKDKFKEMITAVRENNYSTAKEVLSSIVQERYMTRLNKHKEQ